MANQTVYPYGTGGQLPANIGIINDLKTGGANKALSAEMGKVLGEEIGGGLEEILTAELTHNNLAIRSSKVWQVGTHVAISVTPGEEITVTAVSMTTDGGYCAFVTKLYDDTQVSGGAVPLLPNGSIWWQGGTARTFTVPDYAKYIILTTSTTGYQTEYSVKRTLPYNFFSEEDGKAIQDILEPGYDEVDLDELSVVQLYPVSSANPKTWATSGQHIAAPVTPGTKIRLNVLSASQNGCWYFFVTDGYEDSLSSGSIIPLVGSLTWFTYPNSDGQVITVPGGAAYICLCSSNGYKAIWDLSVQRTVESNFLAEDDIVNDLNTGGTKKVLSAEQGKVLARKISDGIPDGLTTHTYEGALVKIGNTHRVACNVVSQITSIACQGGACFGDYLFMFTANNGTCWVYNLATNTLLQTITIPSSERGFVSNCHCNTVNFGTEYYDANDPFPLIYVSTGYASGEYTGALVYRIVATTESDVTTYSLVLVQTLKIPGTSWSEFIVGEDGCCFISYFTTIYRMKMPKLSDGDITFNFDNALGVYKFSPKPESWNNSRGQNVIYGNGKLYMVSGVPASGEKSLFAVLNLTTGIREVVIDFQEIGLTSEPETCFIWNGHICIAFRSNANIYALYFE